MPDLPDLWEFLNSQFARTVISSMAGAGLGAWTAQRIVAKNKDREEILKEVRASNVAATITYGITEAFIAVKKQHVKPLFDEFVKGKEALIAFHKSLPKMPPSSIPLVYAFNSDLRTLTPVKSPIDQLQKIVFERVSVGTKAISVLSVLDRTLHAMNELITKRNEIVEEFKANAPVDPIVYFGLPTSNGEDLRYASTVAALSEYTDNAIYFSKLLADDLVAHGNALKAKLPKSLQAGTPIIASADYSKVADIMPRASDYPDWETMFRNIRPLGAGIWTAEFEAMALAQM